MEKTVRDDKDDDVKSDDIKDNTKGSIGSEIKSWVKVIVLAATFAWIVNNYIIINAYVPTGSMENAIMTNDRVVASRLAYINSEPQRFDIVVFPSPDEPSILYVKRIIGMPGERVTIVNGAIFIDDYVEPLDESTFTRVPYPWLQTLEPFVVPEGMFFMLGDNRSNSRDSRYWQEPFIEGESILGRVVFRYFRGFKIF